MKTTNTTSGVRDALQSLIDLAEKHAPRAVTDEGLQALEVITKGREMLHALETPILFHRVYGNEYRAPKNLENNLEAYRETLRKAYGSLIGVTIFYKVRLSASV